IHDQILDERIRAITLAFTHCRCVHKTAGITVGENHLIHVFEIENVIHRRVVELNFRICAIHTISIAKTRME
ncbi:hypothetical protein PENTCL1PPCAC_13449, partial [Pristionchus entomophagus]